MSVTFESVSKARRLKSMLKADARRMFTSSFFYIMAGIALVIPVLILVMTSMMDGAVSVDPQTGKETVMEGFDHVWQIIGSVSGGESGGAEAAAGMSLTAMCNINLLYFLFAVFTCIFVSADFRSGYAKNLFTVRQEKGDYVISKTVLCFAAGVIMLALFFLGAMVGGKIAGLPFSVEGVSIGNILCCMLAKAGLSLVFVGVAVLGACIAKQRAWLSVVLSFAFGMLFFSMVSMITPLNATLLHVLLCLVGGGLFALGLGFGSRAVLNKTALV